MVDFEAGSVGSTVQEKERLVEKKMRLGFDDSMVVSRESKKSKAMRKRIHKNRYQRGIELFSSGFKKCQELRT